MQSSREGGSEGTCRDISARICGTRTRGILMRGLFAIRPSEFLASGSMEPPRHLPRRRRLCPSPLSSPSLDFFLRAGFNDLNTVNGAVTDY